MKDDHCDERCQCFAERYDDGDVLCLFMETKCKPFFCHEHMKVEMIHQLITITT